MSSPAAPASVIRRYTDIGPTLWANGLGWTTELIPWVAGQPQIPVGCRWRVSIARLSGPAPFSPLPGVDRVFAPVGGSVVLRVNGVDRTVPDQGVTAFRGDDDVEAMELGGSTVHAVNLMSRGAPAALTLLTGRSDQLPLDRALAVVVLEKVGQLERFDLVAPEAPELKTPTNVAMVVPAAWR